MRWNSRLYSELFLPLSIFKEHYFSGRALRILFSQKVDWENEIRTGFSRTRHQMTFGEITTDSPTSYDLIVPLTMDALRQTCAMRDIFQSNPIPIPRLESVNLCDDKVRFNDALIEQGFGRYIPQMGGDLSHPYVVKRRVDEWARFCHVIHSDADEKNHASQLIDPNFFTQQLVAGATEYATHIIFKDGKIACALNIEYHFNTTTPIKGRDKPIFLRPCPCYHLSLFAEILKAIDFEGLCCVNYKLQGKRPMILEINPRFGSSLAQFFFTFVRRVS